MSVLENLYNIKVYSYSNTTNISAVNYAHIYAIKIANVVIMNIKYARVAQNGVLLPFDQLPDDFRPRSDVYLSGCAAHNINMDYHWLKITTAGFFYTHNAANSNVANLETTIAYETRLW
mgnify:CR=1 FL=1